MKMLIVNMSPYRKRQNKKLNICNKIGTKPIEYEMWTTIKMI